MVRLRKLEAPGRSCRCLASRKGDLRERGIGNNSALFLRTFGGGFKERATENANDLSIRQDFLN